MDSERAGQRLDNFLLAHLKGVPRAHIYQLIRSGQVRVNSRRAAPRLKLEAGDRVRIPPVRQRRPAAATLEPEGLAWLESRIVHEDAHLIVLDKPAGLAVHAGSGVTLGCIEALRALRPQLKTLELVHRLDRATSGCLLVAKKRSTLRLLHGMLREGGIEKRYLALLRGDWQLGRRAITEPLAERRARGAFRVEVDPAGKPARSEFRLLESFGLASYMEIEIATGRTHQIRVHAAHLQHPIAGDDRYGDADFNARLLRLGLRRMFLHAHALAFEWPGEEGEFSISVPLPAELGDLLHKLSSSARDS